jgi:hypothetical protein
MKKTMDWSMFYTAASVLCVCAITFFCLVVAAMPEHCPKHMDNWKCEPGETMRILVRYSDHTPFISCSRDHEVPENAHIAENEP